MELYDEIIAERQNMNEAIGRILSEEEMKTFTSLAEKLAEGLEKRAEESPADEPICQ